MKKKVLVILASLILCASITACGKASAKNERQLSSSSESITSSSKSTQTANVATKTINENSDSGEGYTVEDYNFLKEYTSQLEGFVDLTGKSYKTAEERLKAVKIAGAIASEWQRKGDAKVVNQHDNYIYVKFSNGMTYIYYPMASDEISGGVPSDTHVSIYSMQVRKAECAALGEVVERLDIAATDGSAAKIADALDNFTWDYNLDNKDVTLREAAHIGQNKFVLWHGHGVYFEEYGPCLVLEESTSDANYLFVETTLLNNGKYLVTPQFVNKYFDDMTGTFIYISSCSGLRDNRLAEAFSAKNATAIVANTDVISTSYSCNMMEAVTNGLLEGKKLDDAMASAKEKYGEHDLWFYGNYKALGYAEAPDFWGGDYGALGYSVPTVYKGGDYQLFVKPMLYFSIKDDNGLPLSGVTIEYTFGEMADYSGGTTLETDGEGRATVDAKVGGLFYRLTKEGYESADFSAVIPKDKEVNEVSVTLKKKASGVTGTFKTYASIITELKVPEANGEFYIAWEAGFRNNPPAGEIRARVDSNTSYYFAAPGETDYIKERSVDEYKFFENLNNSVEDLRRGGRGEVGVVMYIENGVATSMLLVVS